jgi:hypothetical protein
MRERYAIFIARERSRLAGDAALAEADGDG